MSRQTRENRYSANCARRLDSIDPKRQSRVPRIEYTVVSATGQTPYIAQLVHPDVIMWASDFPHERERDQFSGDLPHLKAHKDLIDEFKQKMLYDNPVRFYRFSKGDITAARQAKGH